MLDSWVLDWFIILNVTTLGIGALGLLVGYLRQF